MTRPRLQRRPLRAAVARQPDKRQADGLAAPETDHDRTTEATILAGLLSGLRGTGGRRHSAKPGDPEKRPSRDRVHGTLPP